MSGSLVLMAGQILALAGGVAAWAATLFNGQASPCPDISDLNSTLLPLLSSRAKVWWPGTEGFEVATHRWTPRVNPQYEVVVDVATEEDVGHTISYANTKSMPFLALSGKHGYNNNLNRVKHGVGINLRNMKSLELAEDGKSARVGGGILSYDLTHGLWGMGKMTTAGTCECTGSVAPMLGGGHGWLQGQYGLMADNLVSARLALANGSIITVSDDEHPDLFWALRGAGHNFGIVTSFEYKVYDRTNENEKFPLDQMVFTGDKLEDVFAEQNRMLAHNRPVELMIFAMLFPMPDVDPEKPVIILFLIWQGASLPKQYSDPFTKLNPVAHTTLQTDFIGLAKPTQFSLDSAACQSGTTWVPFPAGTVDVPIAGIREAYELQASLPPHLNNSWTVVEGYSMAGVQRVDPDSTAFPERQNNLLISPFMLYSQTGNTSADEKGVADAFAYGRRIRDAIANAAGPRLYSYVNYNSANESIEAVYGYEEWRIEKLRRLKREFDPEGRFNFYNPISSGSRT